MSCFSGISAAITNDCDNVPVGALEVVAYAFNRTDATFTVDGTDANKITEITMAGGKKLYKVTAIKKETNGGFDLATADNLPNLFAHKIVLQPYVKTAAGIKNLDQMNDICVVVELKGKKGEGSFVLLGAYSGLQLSSASGMFNDNNGIPTYEFSTREGEGEEFSRYIFHKTDYSVSKARLETLTA